MVVSKLIASVGWGERRPYGATFALVTLLAQRIPAFELIVLYLSPLNRHTRWALQKLKFEFVVGSVV
ncbi:MAG: hypothetical protein KDE48_20820 [Anaerolineales bacterium]|nr:hypothetical protein [Anaerolineales bacterium]